MEKTTLVECVSMLKVNFSLNVTQEDLQLYCRMAYPILAKHGVTDDALRGATIGIIEKTTKNNFRALPCVGDLLEALGLAPKSEKELAESQAEVVLEEIGKFHTVPQYKIMFDDQVTNYVIQNTFGGMSAISWELNQFNENKSKPEWVKKRFIEAYKSAKERGKGQSTPVISASQALHDDGGVRIVGDAAKCATMLESKKTDYSASVKQLANKLSAK